MIDSKMDQTLLDFSRLGLNATPLPSPLKLVGNYAIDSLRSKRKTKTMMSRSASLAFSPCTNKFIKAIGNPWSPDATGACIPTFPARESQKVTSFNRFDVVIGTAGFGYAMFSPCLASDSVVAYYSTAAFTQTLAVANFTTAGVVATVGVATAVLSNLPYSGNEIIGGLVNGRIVSFGASAQYTGTQLNLSGLFYCYASPDHSTLAGSTTSTIGSRLEADISPTSRDKCWLTVAPITTAETEYVRPIVQNNTVATTLYDESVIQLYPFSNGAYLNLSASAVLSGSGYFGSAPAVMLFTGVAGTTIHVEIVQHSEFVGQNTEGRTTSSTSDPNGLNIALTAAGKAYGLKQSLPQLSYAQVLVKAVASTVREMNQREPLRL